MTRGEIFTQILSEVSGKPKAEVDSMFKIFRQANPGDK